jgi:hypothetical protein
MNILIKTKSFLVSLFILFLGVISLIMENIFYGYVDQNRVLQESFFLPMGTVSLLLGIAGLIGSIIWFYLKNEKSWLLKKMAKRLKKPPSGSS